MTFISILVPTRNRADTLRYSLRTLTNIDDDRIEIIVSDNASIDNTREIVCDFRDPRVRYVNTGKSTGMSQNWEFALSHARGDWVSYLGDDDGMLPDAFSRLREIIKGTGIKAVRNVNCNFVWPSLVEGRRGILSVPAKRDVVILDARQELQRVLNGRVKYTRLPVIYNGGFVERVVLDRTRDAKGRFFQSSQPDVYSGMVLASQLDRYVWSEVPFAINGASIHSTGSSQFTKSSDTTRRKAVEAFSREDNIPFHDAIPYNPDGSFPRSLQVVVLEAWYQARELFDNMPEIEPEDQLRAVAREASDIAPLIDWITVFAHRNGLDGEEIIRATSLDRRLNRLRAARDLVWTPHWHADLAPNSPLETVEDATRVVAEVIRRAPAPTKVAIQNSLRIALKMTARGLQRFKPSRSHALHEAG